MKIPYGNADFADIRRRGMFYVDKTPFLAELENDELGYKFLIFLRPRRFGKSSLVSLLENYYGMHRVNEFDELFRGLWVHEHPTPEKNKYLILTLDFSQMGAGGGSRERLEESFLDAMRSSVKTLCLRHRDRFPELGKMYSELMIYKSATGMLADLLGIAAGLGEQIYILIDEYDTFANDLLSAGNVDLYAAVTDKAGFVREFYRAIKVGTRSGAVGRLFVTGATPILLDDLMTGFNIVTNISNRARFNALVGFTRADVERAVDELLASRPELSAVEGIGDRAKLLEVLEQYYDGYRFSPMATERVFNSDLVLHFLRDLADLGAYPTQMLDPNARTDYRKLHALWATAGKAPEERRQVLETVLNENHVWSDLVEQFGRKTISTTSQFVSLMYYTGMLTLSTDPPEGILVRFETPNRVIRELGWEHYAQLLQDLEGVDLTGQPVSVALRTMAKTGDIGPLLDVLRENVLKVLGLKDLRRYNEKSMKMLLIGAIVPTGMFYVLSEKEFAQGYTDLFLSPMPQLPNGKYAWIIELKYLQATATEAHVRAAVDEAEGQLRKYSSDAQLLPMLTRGLELKAGTLVFVGCKDVQWWPFTAPRD
ncbi:MAG: AAA family ATPase [Polyangiaceae bacterium]|nr:AAA family ATPase [Polyangiaceae bacterium]